MARTPETPKTEIVTPMGKREANKRKKLDKIARAAKLVFTKNGFDATTMQQIAKTAGVAVGTLFLYADNKRDLAYVATQDDFNMAREKAFEVPDTLPLTDQIEQIFLPYFELHNANSEMAKIVLGEFNFNLGAQARQHVEGIAMTKLLLARRVSIRQQVGEIDPTINPDEIATIFYFLYQGVVREWVRSGAISAQGGARMLRRAIETVVDGLRNRREMTTHDTEVKHAPG